MLQNEGKPLGFTLNRKGNSGLPVVSGHHIPMLRFPSLDRTGIVEHGFTTRLGGVSGFEPGMEHLRSLNLSFTWGDREENVRENFRRVAGEFGVSLDRFVLSAQTHTKNVRLVTEADAGMGLTRPLAWTDVDGLVTDVPQLVLSIFVADCVPVAFVDPVHRAIGLAHSGWRGTAGRIGQVTVAMMKDHFGSRPEDLICAIGPSICRDCYEVGEDVAQQMDAAFPGHLDEILEDRHNGHYQLDLWKANRIVLEDAGVLPSHISVTDVCTCCNPEVLYSHRASHGRRGNLGVFLMLKP
ncbi:MAG: peptidoglycan editing factor PgeF [Eubacterium sp.]|nr:peptidoglycan editing factor PgeF [Eubacterium sp.]